MRHAILVLLVLSWAAPAGSQPAAPFDATFLPRTMRVDYFHTGGLGQEIFALDRVVDDGAWAGSRGEVRHSPEEHIRHGPNPVTPRCRPIA